MNVLPVTALSTWVHCPKQFYLNYVLDIREPPNGAMILGLIKHKLHEKISQEEQNTITTIKPTDNLQETFKTQYTLYLKDIVTKHAMALKKVQIPLTTAFQKISHITTQQAAWQTNRLTPYIQQGLTGEKLWETLTPKIKVEYSVQSKKLGLKGRIDRLELYSNGLMPVELKSGNPPQEGVWGHHRIQAASYAVMLEEVFSTTVPEAIVLYVDHGSRRSIVLNPFTRENITDTLALVRNCLESRQIPEGCGKEHCTACKDRVFQNKL